uniref:Uncharacterized protein n=1 Tax=Aplanochytrium stocchinoi TaxID=215587 RepID=A0A7S3PNU0_9STRA
MPCDISEFYWPAPSCGFFGLCLNGSCVCNKGWSDTIEFSYFGNVDGVVNETSFCNYNEDLATMSYTVTLILAFAAIIVQVFSSEFEQRDERCLFCGLFMVSGFCLIRIKDPDSSLFGVSLPFSVLVANATTLFGAAQVLYFNGYLDYLSKTFSISGNNYIGLAKSYLKQETVIIISDVVMFQPWWLSTFTHANKNASLVLVRLSLGYTVFRVLYVIPLVYILHRYIQDMDHILSLKPSQHTQDAEFIKLVQKKLPQTKRMRKLLFVYCFLAIPFYSLPLMWNFILSEMMYILPLDFSLFIILAAVPILLVRWGEKTKTTSKDMAPAVSDYNRIEVGAVPSNESDNSKNEIKIDRKYIKETQISTTTDVDAASSI